MNDILDSQQTSSSILLKIHESINENKIQLNTITQDIKFFIEKLFIDGCFYKIKIEMHSLFKNVMNYPGFLTNFFKSIKSLEDSRYCVFWIFIIGVQHRCRSGLQERKNILESSLLLSTQDEIMSFWSISESENIFPVTYINSTLHIKGLNKKNVNLTIDQFFECYFKFGDDFLTDYVDTLIFFIRNDKISARDKKRLNYLVLEKKEIIKKCLNSIENYGTMVKNNYFTYQEFFNWYNELSYVKIFEIGIFFKFLNEFSRNLPSNLNVFTRFIKAIMHDENNIPNLIDNFDSFGFTLIDMKILLKKAIIFKNEYFNLISNRELFEFCIANFYGSQLLFFKPKKLIEKFLYTPSQISNLSRTVFVNISHYDYNFFENIILDKSNYDIFGLMIVKQHYKDICNFLKMRTLKTNNPEICFAYIFIQLYEYFEKSHPFYIDLHGIKIPRNDIKKMILNSLFEIELHITSVSFPEKYKTFKAYVCLNGIYEIFHLRYYFVMRNYEIDIFENEEDRVWAGWHNLMMSYFMDDAILEYVKKFVVLNQNMIPTNELIEILNIFFNQDKKKCINFLKCIYDILNLSHLNKIKEIQKFNLIIESFVADDKSKNDIGIVVSSLKRKLENDVILTNSNNILKKLKNGEEMNNENIIQLLENVINERPSILIDNYLAENPNELSCCSICANIYSLCSFRIFECGHSLCVICSQNLKDCHRCRKPITKLNPIVQETSGDDLKQNILAILNNYKFLKNEI